MAPTFFVEMNGGLEIQTRRRTVFVELRPEKAVALPWSLLCLDSALRRADTK
jgi:hypothetical protein